MFFISCFFYAYFIQSIFRCSIEFCFFYLQIKNYPQKLFQPTFKCDTGFPCTGITDCFPSRPQEKLFLSIVVKITATVHLILGLLDLTAIMIKINAPLSTFLNRFVSKNILTKISKSSNIIKDKVWNDVYAPKLMPLQELVNIKKYNPETTNLKVMEVLDQRTLQRVSKYYSQHDGPDKRRKRNILKIRRGANDFQFDESENGDTDWDEKMEEFKAGIQIEDAEVDDSPIGNFNIFDNNENSDLEAEIEMEYCDMDGSGYSDENEDDEYDEDDDLDDLLAEYDEEDEQENDDYDDGDDNHSFGNDY